MVFEAPLLTFDLYCSLGLAEVGHHSAISLQVFSQSAVVIAVYRLLTSCLPLVAPIFPYFFSLLEGECAAKLCSPKQQMDWSIFHFFLEWKCSCFLSQRPVIRKLWLVCLLFAQYLQYGNHGQSLLCSSSPLAEEVMDGNTWNT